MKIALSFPGCHRRGGVERVMFECANYLAERGREAHVYASDLDSAGLHPRVVQQRVDLPRCPRALRPLAFRMRSSRQLSSSDVHGAFGVESPPGGVLWVGSVHRAWLDISGRQRNLEGRLRQRCNLFHPVILGLERQCFGRRRYRKLIALTEQVKADLIRFYDVPAEDIVIIPNGYSPSEFNLDRRQELRGVMRSRLGYQEDQRVVIFVANELERKGFAPLLRAIAALKDPRICLLAVGRMRPDSYRTEIERLGMAKRVCFTGPTSDVATFYAAADLFALPTQYEAWGLVIVEAMACGLPVLTSRLAGAAITVQEGRTGELLDNPRDAGEIAVKLETLLAGAHVSGAEIAASVAPYAWSRVLQRYEQVLLESAG